MTALRTIGAAVLVACAFLSVSCCKHRYYQQLKSDPAMAEIRLMQNADPAMALEAALKRHDKRFLGVESFAVEIPGAEDYWDTLVREHGLRIITGGGDYKIGKERVELIRGARRFAERYNKLLTQNILIAGCR